jgi:[acyl-carrier-protein] S-malonyltransferase
MGADLAGAYPEARQVFQQADEILGFPLSDLCFSGPQETLDDTVNTQPALFVTSLAVLRVLERHLVPAIPRTGQFRYPRGLAKRGYAPLGSIPTPAAAVAGHSLGELTALVAAGAMDLAAGLRLVRERGRLMKLAGERNPGCMAAVLGLGDATVQETANAAGAHVANYNAPGQVVISGDREAVEDAIERLRAKGARRVVPLAVSIAAHSPLMASIVSEYRAAVEATPLQRPQVPVIGNISARPLKTVDDIRDELAGQLTWPVRWTETVQWLMAEGISCFVEVGPKDVLTKLTKRIGRTAPPAADGWRLAVMRANDVASVRAVAEQLGGVQGQALTPAAEGKQRP